jgi:hypothetical protein
MRMARSARTAYDEKDEPLLDYVSEGGGKGVLISRFVTSQRAGRFAASSEKVQATKAVTMAAAAQPSGLCARAACDPATARRGRSGHEPACSLPPVAAAAAPHRLFRPF